jgi:hypothetical protein
MDEYAGYNIGDIITICRSINGESVVIGKAKIVLFRNSQCGLKIISEDPVIQIGDFIKETNETSISMQYNFSKNRNRTLTYVSLGVGIMASGLGYNFYRTATERYDDYKVATTSQDAIRLYDHAEKNYNYSKVSLSVGGGLLLFALINELILMPKPQKFNEFSIHTNAAQRTIGISYNF